MQMASKSLLIELSKLRYCISYDEVKWYKHSLMMIQSTLPTFVIAGFTQFVADNVDHKVKFMKSSNVAKRVGVKLHWYTQPAFKALSTIKFTPMKDLIDQLPSSSSELAVDIILHSASIFRKAERLGPRSNWNGFMENITVGCRHPEKSTKYYVATD